MIKTLIYDLYSAEFGSAYLVAYAACLGIWIAVIFAFIYRYNAGEFVYHLVKYGAKTAESGKNLREIGLGGHILIPWMLRDKTMLRRITSVADGAPSKKNGKIDLKRARFYFTEDQRVSAECRFPRERRPILGIILTTAAVILLAIGVHSYLPQVTEILQVY